MQTIDSTQYVKDLKQLAEVMQSIAQAIMLPKCLICKRRVVCPCNTFDSMMENGPWDTWCEDYKYR